MGLRKIAYYLAVGLAVLFFALGFLAILFLFLL